MDEFETKIKNAQTPIEPREDFVESTMKQVQATTPRKKWGMKIWIPSAAAGTVIVVAAILFLPLLHGSQPVASGTKTAIKTTSPTSKTPSQPSTTSPTITSSTGTDDASLQSDLNGINSSMNQENSDQNNANSNLNDSSQEITVPSS